MTTLREIALHDDEVLITAYEVECAATAAIRPGWAPLGSAARLARWRADDAWQRTFIGAFDDEQVVGLAVVQTPDDEPDISWIDVNVHPSHQQRGVATELVSAAEAMSRSGPRRFLARAYRTSTALMSQLVDNFATPLGYSIATTETVVELDLAASALLPAATPTSYSISTYINGVPAALRAEVGVIKGLVDAEAPSGDLDWSATPVSDKEYVEEIELWVAQGITVIETLAVAPDASIAAWTCLLVSADTARPSEIEGTLVLQAHRGHRLGMAVKVASLRAALQHGARRVRTSSDDENLWMRAINEELGFHPVETEAILRKRRA